MAAVPGFEPLENDVDTPDFNNFFDDQYIRRNILTVINRAINLRRCVMMGLSQEEYNAWLPGIIAILTSLGDIYETRNLPEMVELACHDENNNAGNGVGQLNQAFVAGNNFNQGNNNNGLLPNNGHRYIPAGAENTIMSDEIEDGDLMVNFQDEFGHSRYYKKSTYNSLNPGGQKRNPYTQQPIVNARTYTAVVGPPVEGGYSTKRHKRRRNRNLKHTRR